MIKKMDLLQFLKLPRNKNLFSLSVYLFLIILLLSIPLHYLTAVGIPVSGRIIYSNASVSVTRHSEKTEKGSLATVHEGDLLSTGETARTSISFKNNLCLRLSRGTVLELTRVRLHCNNLIDFLKGKSNGLWAIGGEITLTKGNLWIDKTAGAKFTVWAGDAVVFPGRGACDIFRNPRGSVCVSVYRGDVKVGVKDHLVFKAKIFPGQECVINNRKFEKIAALKYRPGDPWQNWNMALSYVAPPGQKSRLVASHFDRWKQETAPPPQDTGMKRRPDNQRADPGAQEMNNQYSFEKWVEQSTNGGKESYPKYRPPGGKVARNQYSDFPEAPASGNGGSDASAPPAPPAMGPGGITSIFTAPYSGTSFTPVWGAADGGSSSSDTSSASSSAPQEEPKSHKGGKSKDVWLPFLQEDNNAPPSPPSLNSPEEQ